jgi:hypothetical protein
MPIPQEKLDVQYWIDRGYSISPNRHCLNHNGMMVMQHARRDNIVELSIMDFERILHFASKDEALFDMLEQLKLYMVMKHGLDRKESSSYYPEAHLGEQLLKKRLRDIENGQTIL